MKLKDLVDVLDQDTFVKIYISNNNSKPITDYIGNLVDNFVETYREHEVEHIYVDDSLSVYDACLVILLRG